MKKLTINIVLTLLCLNFTASAQQENAKNSLKIGDTVSDITIENIINYPAKSVKLSSFRGKLLILDFWATWCAPCVFMIPRMDSLQKAFAGKVQFLSVTDQSEKEVQTFLDMLEKQQETHYNLPDVVSNNALTTLFPHNTIPHYVWIDANGKVMAITEFGEVNRTNLAAALQKQSLSLTEKGYIQPLAYDYHKPLLLNNNGGDGKNMLYHSVLTSYTPGMHSGFVFLSDPDSGKKITCKNTAIAWLYKIAYSDSGRTFNERNTVLRVRDTTKITNEKDYGQRYRDWLADGNGFCYELMVPKELLRQALKIMQQDLDRYFTQYKAQIVKEKKHCLILIKTGPGDLKTIGGERQASFDRFSWKFVNCPAELFVENLNDRHIFKLPIVDETNLKQLIDLDINVSAGITGSPDIDAINKELEKYKLKFIEGDRAIEELVISDRLPN